nr:MAG TPA: hypothetical protein [Caudoviricetes sp.]
MRRQCAFLFYVLFYAILYMRICCAVLFCMYFNLIIVLHFM